MNIQVAGNKVLISWPAAAPGYQLESTSSIGGAKPWAPVTNTPASVGRQRVATYSIFNSERYFGLKRFQQARGVLESASENEEGAAAMARLPNLYPMS